jgi:hypothetical protein
MRSAFADKSQTSLILLGSFFINIEFVCCPESVRSGFALGNTKIIILVNFREAHAMYWMFFSCDKHPDHARAAIIP